jgi:hypothetical protein
MKSARKTYKNFNPQTREEFLALELAEALDDMKGFHFYFSCTRKFPESVLRKILIEVKETPSNKIKKSRGALFNYLIQKYVQESNNNYRN